METFPLLEDKLASLPAQPGVYLMKDGAGNVLYVGKAITLRSRVRSYFQASADHPIKTKVLVSKVADFDYLITATEKEARPASTCEESATPQSEVTGMGFRSLPITKRPSSTIHPSS